MRKAAIVLALLGGLALVGCTTAPGAKSTPSTSSSLVELREAYGLPDCPVSDPSVEAVEGGLPRTELPCLGSDRVVNLAGLPRRPLVVNFWAQWCQPCRQESPFLRAAVEAGGAEFIGINYDDPDQALAIEFAGLAGLTYPHVRDRHKQLASLGVPGLPVTLFVDAEGRVTGSHVGVLESGEQLADLMREYLGVS